MTAAPLLLPALAPGTEPITAAPGRVPSPSQRAAIEAPPAALLVLAGPGAGRRSASSSGSASCSSSSAIDPARICAFTFTNKAAGEIAERLARTLGDRARRG